MHEDIKLPVERAEQFLREMETEYQKCLKMKAVSPLAKQLMHEVCEKIKSCLDRTAQRYFALKIKPSLTPEEASKALIYFPIVDDHHSLESTFGRWRWKTVREKHDDFYRYVRNLQSFENRSHDWLSIVSHLANHGKHIGLIPQIISEEKRTTVTDVRGFSISWGSGVTFGPGVSIMGAPVNPSTQRIQPTLGVTERQEIWVSFLIEGYGVDALSFCKDAVRKTKVIVEDISEKFGL